ncbi:hypothetical protein A2Y85_06550 [candidate division WOR-3 bacterium RBG_13_43_14]|uniref:AraC effector-binding domain-containing protein n=1 Tax=candidate division WOR-3 bacterium RBG_13_43_14 TaxID=1802590 RepID=A0A1F4U220_UNCW3|nr:MAG: hypothetical protein A2Y85_06550 [candidate division WOR-3 bacterium RBG_13_43_14]
MLKIINTMIIILIMSTGLAIAQGCVGCQKCVENVEIVEMGKMTVVGLNTFASSDHNLFPQLWKRFMERCSEIKGIAKEKVMLGVSYAMQPMSEENKYTFFHLVGFIVNDTKNIPEGMTYKTIPKHKYARFQHKGKLDGLAKTYGCIYGEWLPTAPYEYDNEACELEWYDERFIPDSDESVMEIYLPIKDKL